ncbi:MAG: hypothetical protein IJJ28_07050, partial [Lentisphaeria bacterium]|nr:hypothetical protein [Lentisphaeria bacterium]
MAEYTNVVISGTTQRVNAGDIYTSTTVTAGGLLEMVGGSAAATMLNDNGRLWAQTQAHVSGVSAAGGSCRISAFHAGTFLEDIHIDSGVNAVATPRLDIRAGVRVSGVTVSGAYVQVTGAAAQISGAVLDSSAQMRVYNAAIGSGITLTHEGCDLKIYQSNATVNDLNAQTGNVSVYQTGSLTNATIGKYLRIDDGYASGVQLLSNGTAFLGNASARLENVHINSGGRNAAAYPNLDIRAGLASGVVASGAAIQVTGANARIADVTMEQNGTLVV